MTTPDRKSPDWLAILVIASFDALAAYLQLELFRDRSFEELLEKMPSLGDAARHHASYVRLLTFATVSRFFYGAAVIAIVRWIFRSFSSLSDASARTWVVTSLGHWFVMTFLALVVSAGDRSGLPLVGVATEGVAAIVGALFAAAVCGAVMARRAIRRRIESGAVPSQNSRDI